MIYAVNNNGDVFEYGLDIIKDDFRGLDLKFLKNKIMSPYVIQFGLPDKVNTCRQQLLDFFANEKNPISYFFYEVITYADTLPLSSTLVDNGKKLNLFSAQKNMPYMNYCDLWVWANSHTFDTRGKTPLFDKKIEKSFLLLNNKNKPERKYITSYILGNKDLQSRSVVSWWTPAEKTYDKVYDWNNLNLKGAQKLKNKIIPKNSDNLDALYKQCFCRIVTETMFDNYANISEKTFYNFIHCTPFVLVAPKHTLKLLHELGFQTFGDYWPEDYDHFEGEERLKRIQKTIDKIGRMSNNALNEMYNDMKPRLIYNFKHISNLNKIYTNLYLEGLS